MNKSVEEENEQAENNKELVQLKYILLKNLASINTKNRIDLTKALNYLIEVFFFLNN